MTAIGVQPGPRGALIRGFCCCHAQALLPKGLVGSVGYSSDEVTKTKATFTENKEIYYTHAK